MNILDLYQDDVDGRVISVSGGQEHRGPCPVCGGEDRFGVWPEQDKRGTFYCGREKGVGNGCGIGGDAIQYLRTVRGYSYHEACNCLGIEPKRGGSTLKYSAPVIPKKRNRQEQLADSLVYPEEVVDPARWREHGMKFVNNCHQALLERRPSIAYLMARGIDMARIEKYKLGFHAGSTRGSRQYENSYRPWPSWGLRDEKKPGGKSRMIALPAGIVIPYMPGGVLHRINIRLIKPDSKYPKKKYHKVKGSMSDLWISNPSAKAFITQEAELDCIAIDCAAGDLVGTIGLGTTGTKPDADFDKTLQNSLAILDSLDYDAPRFNEKTKRVERPGGQAGKWWRKRYDQCVRWPVPKGKDVGEAYQKGVVLRPWILAGLPPVFHEQKKAASNHVAKPETVQQKPAGQGVTDLQQLQQLLEESAGFIKIANGGYSVGPVIPPGWSERYPQKRQKITWLLFNSEQIGDFIGNMADGIYGADRVRV